MNFPSHYLAIKPIFDLSLFGVEDAEKSFIFNEKLAFSKEFSSYQTRFLVNEDSDGNEILLQTCFLYLSELERDAREDVVRVILENTAFAEALIMLTMMNDGVLDPEQGTIKFHYGLSAYIEENKINESIVLFFQQHFLNLERIEPANFQNFQLTRSEYFNLISDYLKVQSNIF